MKEVSERWGHGARLTRVWPTEKPFTLGRYRASGGSSLSGEAIGCPCWHHLSRRFMENRPGCVSWAELRAAGGAPPPPAPGQWQKGALCSRDGRTSRSGGVRSEDCESLFGLSSCPGCLLRGQVGTSRSQVDNVGMGLREALLGAGTAAVGQ